MLHIVAVDRAYVVEAELFEERAARNEAPCELLRLLYGAFKLTRELLGDLLPDFPNAQIGFRRQGPR